MTIINPRSTIRNSQSKTQITVHMISSKGRLCLTSTPSQKILQNLMDLLNFICLGMKTSYNNQAEILKPYLECGKIQAIATHAPKFNATQVDKKILRKLA